MQFSHRHLDSYHVQSFVLAAYDYVESACHAYRILPCCYNWLSLSLCLWLFFCWCCCSHTRCTENPCIALYLPGIKQGWLEYPHLVRWFSCYQPPFSSWQWTNSQRPPPPTYGKRCWCHVFFLWGLKRPDPTDVWHPVKASTTICRPVFFGCDLKCVHMVDVPSSVSGWWSRSLHAFPHVGRVCRFPTRGPLVIAWFINPMHKPHARYIYHKPS